MSDSYEPQSERRHRLFRLLLEPLLAFYPHASNRLEFLRLTLHTLFSSS